MSIFIIYRPVYRALLEWAYLIVRSDELFRNKNIYFTLKTKE